MHTALPQESGTLVYQQLAPHVYEALCLIRRTGWVDRGVPSPETVLDHTRTLVTMAWESTGFNEPERDELARILEVHDWPEAHVGDEVILHTDSEYESKIALKHQRERDAMRAICAELGDEGSLIYTLWERYECADDPLSQYAHELDKYQAIEQAFIYENMYGIPLFAEFYRHSEWKIKHLSLRNKLELLSVEHSKKAPR